MLKERKKKKREWMLKAYMLSAGFRGDRGADTAAAHRIPTQKLLDEEENPMMKDDAEEKEISRRRDASALDLISDSCSDIDGLTNKLDEVSSSEDKQQSSPVRVTDFIEDEDLLKWSQALDYEVYNDNWTKMAVSIPSESAYGKLNHSLSAGGARV